MEYLGKYTELSMPEPGSTVLVGLSGGLDSTFTALWLKEQGCKVIGSTMRTWGGELSPLSELAKQNPLALRGSCYGPDEEIDIQLCKDFCKKNDIPYVTVPVADAYQKNVLNYFTSEYQQGRTPNPCVMCNQNVKFGALLQGAEAQGYKFDYFCTGHYARIVKNEVDDSIHIANGIDGSKDQSYFLYRVPSSVLKKVRFPLGSMKKSEVRAKGLELNLVSAKRAESQDFIPQSQWGTLFPNNSFKSGDIIDESGKVLGKHNGIIYYTIGQRRGLGVSAPYPLYVKEIDRKSNKVIVAREENLVSFGLEATNCVWNGKIPTEPFKCLVKIRLATPATMATVYPEANDSIRVVFDNGLKAVAPGQSAVLYDSDVILGGGIISRSVNE